MSVTMTPVLFFGIIIAFLIMVGIIVDLIERKNKKNGLKNETLVELKNGTVVYNIEKAPAVSALLYTSNGAQVSSIDGNWLIKTRKAGKKGDENFSDAYLISSGKHKLMVYFNVHGYTGNNSYFLKESKKVKLEHHFLNGNTYCLNASIIGMDAVSFSINQMA